MLLTKLKHGAELDNKIIIVLSDYATQKAINKGMALDRLRYVHKTTTSCFELFF